MFPAKFTEYMKHFNMDSPYYSFDYGNVHFLSMATAKNKDHTMKLQNNMNLLKMISKGRMKITVLTG